LKGRLSTRAEAVKALNLQSARALDRLIERGAPAPKPGKRGGRRYDVEAIEAWRAQRLARAKPVLDLTTERARLARAQRKLTTLKLRELRGALIRVKDAERVQAAIAGAAKTQLLAVPRRCVLDGLPREHEALVHKHITQALRELSEIRMIAELQLTPDEGVA
jgi:phage terminase Nu1 subunit (DNA packaging protein)